MKYNLYGIVSDPYPVGSILSGRIRTIWPDPDPFQEMLIRIRVAKKSWKTQIKTNKNYKNMIKNHFFA